MTKIDIEDCLKYVENRFELVILAAKRARDISIYGEQSMVDWNNNKSTVVALREIASGFILPSYLNKN